MEEVQSLKGYDSSDRAVDVAAPKILVAEDNLVNQKLMSMMFDKLNLKVDMVSNGQEAVDAVMAKGYDIVLMDIQMPVMNGLDACLAIKNTDVEKLPVIVALTANSLEGDREKFIQSGMDDYLPKPLSLEDIRKTIEQFSPKS